MELQYSQSKQRIRWVKLIGALDIQGVGEVESKFVGHTAGRGVKVLVDLSDLTFVASTGIRLLLWTAKAVVSQGGTFVMANPIPAVAEVLDISGISALVPIYSDKKAAERDLLHPLGQRLSRGQHQEL